MTDINDIIPASVAVEMRVVPLREVAGILILATDVQNFNETRDRIAFILNRNVRIVTRSCDWMEAELDTRYRSSPELLKNPSENDSRRR